MTIVVVLAIAAGLWAYLLMTRPYKGYVEAETFVEIAPGSTPQRMGRALADAGVVPSPEMFRLAVWSEGAGRRLQAGEYRFDAPMTARAVVEKIVRGDVFLRPVTFREGLTIRQMAAIFAERGFGTATGVRRRGIETSANRGARSRRRAISKGYLFPDTYTLPRHTTADELVARMVARFEKALTPEITHARERARVERARAGDAGVDRRKGDRQARTSGRASPPSTPIV